MLVRAATNSAQDTYSMFQPWVRLLSGYDEGQTCTTHDTYCRYSVAYAPR